MANGGLQLTTISPGPQYLMVYAPNATEVRLGETYADSPVFEVSPASVEAAPGSLELVLGGAATLGAAGVDVRGQGWPDLRFLWEVEATVGTVTPPVGPTTTFTAVAALPEGTWEKVEGEVRATYGVTGAASVAVWEPRVTITGPAAVLLGGDAHMECTVAPPGGTLANWAASDLGVVTIDPLSGLIVGERPGAVQVTVDYTVAGVTTSAPPFTVEVQPAGVVVRPPEATLAVKESREFTAAVRDVHGGEHVAFGGVPVPFAWAHAGDVGSLTPGTGATTLFTAVAELPSGEAERSGTLAASYMDVAGLATITVVSLDFVEIVVEPAAAVLGPGDSVVFRARASDAQGGSRTDLPFAWSVVPDDPTVLPGLVSPSSGPVTSFTATLALAGREAITGRVEAACAGLVGSASVRVIATPPDFLLVSPEPAIVVVGEDASFQAIAFAYREGGPSTPPPPKMDPEDSAWKDRLDTEYQRLGPVRARWHLGPPPQAQEHGKPFASECAIVGADSDGGFEGSLCVVDGGADPGKMTLRAEYVWPSGAPQQGPEDQAELIIAGIERIEFREPPLSASILEVQANSTAIFPGWHSPADRRLNNTVEVVAVITPKEAALVGMNVVFRTFDVDDVLPSEFEEPNFLTENDNRAMYMPEGFARQGRLSATVAEVSTKMEATVILETSLSPGDNYRVVAALKEGLLEGIEAAQDAAGAPLRDAAGSTVSDNTTERALPCRCSDLLTVWRKIHVEADTMAQVTEQSRKEARLLLEGEILSVTVTPRGKVFITMGKISPALPSREEDPEALASLGEGFLDVAGRMPLRVLSCQKAGSDASLEVQPPEKGKAFPKEGQRCVLRDDDNPDLLPADSRALFRWMPPFSERDLAWADARRSPLASAFLVVAYDSPSSEVPFSLNLTFGVPPGEMARAIGREHVQSLDLLTQPEYYSAYLLFAYQCRPSQDGDPEADEHTGGEAKSTLGAAILYVECIHDAFLDLEPGSTNWESHTAQCGLHEMGHAFGLLDVEDPTFMHRYSALSTVWDRPQFSEFEQWGLRQFNVNRARMRWGE